MTTILLFRHPQRLRRNQKTLHLLRRKIARPEWAHLAGPAVAAEAEAPARHLMPIKLRCPRYHHRLGPLEHRRRPDGEPINFDPSGDYHWLIASSSNDLQQIDLQNLEINSTAFANEAAHGACALSTDANGFYINFTPIPEPSATALAALALLILSY
jgi:hypothetical protein